MRFFPWGPCFCNLRTPSRRSKSATALENATSRSAPPRSDSGPWCESELVSSTPSLTVPLIAMYLPQELCLQPPRRQIGQFLRRHREALDSEVPVPIASMIVSDVGVVTP
jgi:hypothetical protein